MAEEKNMSEVDLAALVRSINGPPRSLRIGVFTLDTTSATQTGETDPLFVQYVMEEMAADDSELPDIICVMLQNSTGNATTMKALLDAFDFQLRHRWHATGLDWIHAPGGAHSPDTPHSPSEAHRVCTRVWMRSHLAMHFRLSKQCVPVRLHDAETQIDVFALAPIASLTNAYAHTVQPFALAFCNSAWSASDTKQENDPQRDIVMQTIVHRATQASRRLVQEKKDDAKDVKTSDPAVAALCLFWAGDLRTREKYTSRVPKRRCQQQTCAPHSTSRSVKSARELPTELAELTDAEVCAASRWLEQVQEGIENRGPEFPPVTTTAGTRIRHAYRERIWYLCSRPDKVDVDCTAYDSFQADSGQQHGHVGVFALFDVIFA